MHNNQFLWAGKVETVIRSQRVSFIKSVFVNTAICIAALISTLGAPGKVNASSVTRILVIPLTVHSVDKLEFLQQGITDMLVSRLEMKDKVVVVVADNKKEDIAAMAIKSAADYIVTGSLTVLGDRVSTDVRVLTGTPDNSPVLSFGRKGRQQAEVIDHIDELTNIMNIQLLGRSSVSERKNASTVPALVVKPNGVIAKNEKSAAISSPDTAGRRLQSVWNKEMQAVPLKIDGIEEFKDKLHGLCTGDVDGDGAVDIVTISAKDLFVYKMKQSQWVQMAHYDTAGTFVGVDSADLNKNGRSEIFVTNFNDTQSRVVSFVLEWDGSSLRSIESRLPYYFRSIDISGKRNVIVGQRQGLEERFSPGIYKMEWQGDAYKPGERLPLPENLNIFGFAFGHVRSTDKLDVVRYNSEGAIQILDLSGEEEWVSTDRYGGGSNEIVFSAPNPKDEPDYIYLSPRIHLYDLDGDGVKEMLVVNNQKSFLTGVLQRQRFYEKGCLEWLKWYGQGIRSTARTLDVARFIADSALADIDGDGALEIVAAVVKKSGGISSKPSSYLSVITVNSAILQ